MDSLITRDSCVVTGNKDLEDLITLEKFPVFIGATSEPYSSDKFQDMSWSISKSSGVIQLKNLLPLDLVYSGFHSEAVGSVWENHRNEFAKFVSENKSPGDIYEMGGSDGKIADLFYKENNPDCNWTIVEPNLPDTISCSNERINFVDGYIEEEVKKKENIHNFVHSHVLEHLYNPSDTIEIIANKQSVGDRTIFAIPNLKLYLENLFVNTLNFEHTYYITDDVVNYLFSKSGYKLINKKVYVNHGLYYCFEKTNNLDNEYVIPSESYDVNKKAYKHLIDHYKKEVKNYNKIIDEHDGDIFLFGGHIFSQFLLYLGLNTEKIVSILDNSKQKNNKRLYGYNLNIELPEKIETASSPLVILKVGQYFDEVKQQLLSLNSSVKIVK